MRLIYYVTNLPTPNNKDDPYYNYSKTNWSGTSFLVHPERLFAIPKSEYDLKELAEYVGLASLRNYAEYKVYKKTTLDLVKSPLPEDTLKTNRLLEVRDGKIHFLLEEATEK